VNEPTPRQVLYGLVAGSFLMVVLALMIGAGITGVVSVSWTAAMAVVWLSLAVWSVRNWRRTIPVLLMAMGLFLFWAVATLLLVNT